MASTATTLGYSFLFLSFFFRFRFLPGARYLLSMSCWWWQWCWSLDKAKAVPQVCWGETHKKKETKQNKTKQKRKTGREKRILTHAQHSFLFLSILFIYLFFCPSLSIFPFCDDDDSGGICRCVYEFWCF